MVHLMFDTHQNPLVRRGLETESLPCRARRPHSCFGARPAIAEIVGSFPRIGPEDQAQAYGRGTRKPVRFSSARRAKLSSPEPFPKTGVHLDGRWNQEFFRKRARVPSGRSSAVDFCSSARRGRSRLRYGDIERARGERFFREALHRLRTPPPSSITLRQAQKSRTGRALGQAVRLSSAATSSTTRVVPAALRISSAMADCGFGHDGGRGCSFQCGSRHVAGRGLFRAGSGARPKPQRPPFGGLS